MMIPYWEGNIYLSPLTRVRCSTRSFLIWETWVHWIMLLYSHMHIHLHIYMQNHNGTVIKTREDFFYKKYTSHFICNVCVWELETEQRLQHIDLTSPSGHNHVLFSFSTCLWLLWSPTYSGAPKASSAGRWLSLPQLVSNSSDL